MILGSVLTVASLTTAFAQGKDLSSNYQWKPVRLGAGGFMRGMAVSPSDPTRRYARGDVDQVYSWNQAAKQWIPTKVSSALPANIFAAPTSAGGGAICIDPQHPDHLMVLYTFGRSSDIAGQYAPAKLNVYTSNDGAKTFRAGNLSLNGDGSGETAGERLAIDPGNGNIAYLGSPGLAGESDGLYRTLDGGTTWSGVTGGGLPVTASHVRTGAVRYEFGLPRFDGGSGSISANGQTSTRILYVTYTKHLETRASNGNWSETTIGGGVLRSGDGGKTWKDLGSVNAPIDFATIDASGNLWVSDGSADIYKYSRAGTGWSTSTTPHSGGIAIAVDPANTSRLFVSSWNGGTLARSLDGGQTWTDLGSRLKFSESQPIAWLRPSAIRPQGHAVSTGGLYMDPSGRLWIPCGNDGIITTTPNDQTDTFMNPPVWTSSSEGIEEMVAEIGVIPPGGNPVLTVEDESLFIVTDPNTFTAQHYPLNTWNGNNGLSSATDIAYVPNQPRFLAVVTNNITAGNPLLKSSEFSGYSTDGGNTWSLFPSITGGSHPCILYGGSIAISARNVGQVNSPAGADNLVWIPSNWNDFKHLGMGPAPFYSKDGGATWTQSTSFNSASGAQSLPSACSSGPSSYTYMGHQWGPWNFTLAQHLLVADPVTPGTFYVHLTAGGFWKSTDGGVTWAQEPAAGVPNLPHHGTLATVPGISGEMWLVDGHEGATYHGLFHTIDGGKSFTRNQNFDYAWSLALGKALLGSTYPAVYVYGRMSGDPEWGVFQSIDAGKTFDRISRYPYGIIDVPNTMTASWDSYGVVYLGFNGNSYVYSRITSPAALAATVKHQP